MFALLWILYIPYYGIYVPGGGDVPALADGLLLAPGARWQDWFTRGYAHFWDLYPEWPQRGTGFTRPAFQFLIYLFHFALGNHWASYQIINNLALAGMGAVAFHIAQRVLGLCAKLSWVAVTLIVLSPPILISWLFGLAFAIEPLATVLVGCAFLSILPRRDFLCLALLFAALLTKESTVWAPAAAAVTIMLRRKPDECLSRQALAAAAMFLPLAMWFGLRFAFFGGIGGTYATAGYAPISNFLELIFYKLTHLHYLLLTHRLIDNGTLVTINWGTALLLYALLSLWTLHILAEALNVIRCAKSERCCPTVSTFFLVSLWAAFALVFHFALPLSDERYATSVVLFTWPALVAEVERRRKVIIWLVLGMCSAVSFTQASYRLVEWSGVKLLLWNNTKPITAALHQVPAAIRQVYIVSARGLAHANPEYVRLIHEMSAEIVRVVDVEWSCTNSSNSVTFQHSTSNGVVTMTITLPACAAFFFASNYPLEPISGHLYRNDSMTYELPDAQPINLKDWHLKGTTYLGRQLTLHVRPKGPARFIIQHGGPNGIAWFDGP
jgi:hypothetical protein